MNLGDIGKLLRRNVKEHSPLILSISAGVGVLSTVYLTNKAAFEAYDIIRDDEDLNGVNPDFKERLIRRTKLVWKLYIPASISATATVTCIVGANRIGVKKTIAAQAAFAVSERLYSEYRDKIIEEYGAHKDQSIRDQIADEKVKTTAPPGDIMISGPGNVLCCEMFTGRYFTSDMETLRKAENDLNAKILAHDYASFNDFYYMVGLGSTSASSQLGWKSNKLMKLEFSTVLTEDGRPCLAFEYNYTEPL
jgi:cell division protein FtsL